jgi:hypothetical protein
LRPGVGHQPAEAESDRGLLARGGQGLLDGAQDALGVLEELGAGLGELHVARGPVHEADLERRLQLLDRASQGGLRDQQALGGTGE